AVDPKGQPLATDQRGDGFPRIFNGTVDIGAFEVQATTGNLMVTAQPPGSVVAGAGFGLTVTALDTSGHVDTSFTGTVTVALATNPGGAARGGPLSGMAHAGVAPFAGLTLDKAGTGYTLLVTSPGLGAATTDLFAVTPAAATQLVVTTQPPAVLVASKFNLV